MQNTAAIATISVKAESVSSIQRFSILALPGDDPTKNLWIFYTKKQFGSNSMGNFQGCRQAGSLRPIPGRTKLSTVLIIGNGVLMGCLSISLRKSTLL